LLLMPAALIVHYGAVVREERHLEQKFGDAYRRYRNAVPRYGLPLPDFLAGLETDSASVNPRSLYRRRIMDAVSLASSLVSAQIGRLQLEIAGKMLRLEASQEQSAAATVESAQQDVDGLALLAANLGGKLDVRA
jgi:hypothetical protein